MKDFFEYEIARGKGFKLLAECYLLPAPNIVGKIQDLADILSFVCPESAEPIRECKCRGLNDGDTERLKVDYARLFVGPYSLLAPPYGSVYLESERRIMGDSTLNVLEMYREAGLDMAQDFNDAPDHIVAEMEFMGYLVFKEIEACAGKMYTAAADYVAKQRNFLESHLGAWVFEFSTRVLKSSETEFYRSLSTLTRRFVKKNLESMQQIAVQQIHDRR
jgi:TorA maturation chaperone TorD